jgi:hypothetical protein
MSPFDLCADRSEVEKGMCAKEPAILKDYLLILEFISANQVSRTIENP